jgi:pimeloyl-ACP methyl ester carboxylesterase
VTLPTIKVNGTELFYQVEGKGEPLVLVHGSWGDHFNWQLVVPELARSFRVLTYDRRGHSQSQRPAEGTRRDDEDDLGALLESLAFGPAHVAGNSFGASIALGLATRRPELFRTLVVHEPPLLAIAAEDPAIAPVRAEFQTKIVAVIKRLEGGDIPGGARQFVEEVALGAGAWDQLPPQVRETFVTNALTWLDEQKDPDWTNLALSALSGFPSPVLLSEGDQSLPWFPAINRRLSRTLKNSKRHVFAGAGHVPHMTHPQDYVKTVTDFIRGAGARTSA